MSIGPDYTPGRQRSKPIRRVSIRSALAGVDRDDHKFVAVALANQVMSRILNATDSDWWDYRVPLEANGIQIEFLCPDAMAAR